jgi:hypothetical protein
MAPCIGRIGPARKSRRSTGLPIVALVALSNCTPLPTGPAARAIDAMCVLHTDAIASNAISLNHKVFTAQRDSATSATGFSNFRLVAGPFGDLSLALTNLDALPSVHAISETWFRGVSFNEAVRAQVIPALRTDANGQTLVGEPGTGTGARWNVAAQDFTGTWRVVRQSARLSSYARDQIASNDATGVAQLPQWMHTGIATPQLFFCAGTLSGDGTQTTTALFEYTPAGRSLGPPAIMQIQDVLYGDERFVADPPPDPPIGGRRIAAPTPNNSAVTPRVIANQVVQCAMTQNGDDVSSRSLHLVAASGNQLLHTTLSNFGPVTQQLSRGGPSTFPRFRAVSTWGDVTQLFPATNFGSIDHVAVVATGRDTILHIFFVGNQGGRYRLWHIKRFGNGTFSAPVDVLRDSGDSTNGTVYDMPITASFCPSRGNRTPTLAQVDENIMLAWFEPVTRSILVREVVRTPQIWVTGRPASVYSQAMLAQTAGIAILTSTGTALATTPLRTRVGLRPFPD